MHPSPELRYGCDYLVACLINSFMCLFTMLEREMNIELSNASSLLTVMAMEG
jgi:hypothetical protein